MLNDKPYLRSIKLDYSNVESRDEYPYNIRSLKNLEEIEFHPDVTFIVGENGSGKSTLIEALAVTIGLGREGGTRNFSFESAETISSLNTCIKPVRSFKKPKDYYFLRAESFYNVASYMDSIGDSGYLDPYGGKSLHQQSHGESFMATLLNKLRGHGLYIFDEPEAALSPNRQLAAISAIHDLVKRNSQFIIATHSPIILSYPNSKILRLDEDGVSEVEYEDTEHYAVTREYLNDYEKILKILMEP